MNIEEVRDIYDNSRSKIEIVKKLNIHYKNGVMIDREILKHFSSLGMKNRQDISITSLKAHWKNLDVSNYEEHPVYCEHCSKKLPYDKRYARFCSTSCAAYHNNRGKTLSDETKKKITESVKKHYVDKILLDPHMRLISTLIDEGKIFNEEKYEYEDRYVDVSRLKSYECKNCGKEFYGRITKTGKFKKTKHCCDRCQKEFMKKTMHNKIKLRIKNGTFKGWATRNIISYPEKFWMNVLDSNKISYVHNKPVKHEQDNKNYFLDFYIEKNNVKMDLEIDGKQHKEESRKKSDIERDKYIKASGYVTYRIEWNEITREHGKKLMKDKIDAFMKFYNSL